MPNGTDTVTVQKRDGSVVSIPKSSLSIAVSMGAKPYKPSSTAAPQESTLTKVGRGAALGTFSGLGIPETQHPIPDLLRGLSEHLGGDPTRLLGGPIRKTANAYLDSVSCGARVLVESLAVHAARDFRPR
jgi:hypothetical protein